MSTITTSDDTISEKLNESINRTWKVADLLEAAAVASPANARVLIAQAQDELTTARSGLYTADWKLRNR